MPRHHILRIIDGTALLFRAFYGGATGQDAAGIEVGAVRAVAARLVRHQTASPVSHVAVVFDAGKTTFRTAIDPSYKANRGEPPALLVPQFRRAEEVTSALGMKAVSVAGYEADDLMATLARRGRANDMPIEIVGIDKDLAQLVADEHPPVTQHDPWTGTVWDADGVVARLGVQPEQVVSFQALCGDSADNIGGVRGVGAKTAAALLAHFRDLDDIYDHLDRVRSLPIRGSAALADRLLNGRESALHARRLVSLRDDVPLETSDTLDEFRYSAVVNERILGQVGLHGLSRRNIPTA